MTEQEKEAQDIEDRAEQEAEDGHKSAAVLSYYYASLAWERAGCEEKAKECWRKTGLG